MYFSMDELNEFERLNLRTDDLIAVTFQKPNEHLVKVKRFQYFEIDKALDYFNKKKREGYIVKMRKVDV